MRFDCRFAGDCEGKCYSPSFFSFLPYHALSLSFLLFPLCFSFLSFSFFLFFFSISFSLILPPSNFFGLTLGSFLPLSLLSLMAMCLHMVHPSCAMCHLVSHVPCAMCHMDTCFRWHLPHHMASCHVSFSHGAMW